MNFQQICCDTPPLIPKIDCQELLRPAIVYMDTFPLQVNNINRIILMYLC